eukprot:TRINITY_DN41824_c0_g1_i1.p1 TRINITY_DN41824_c0_g1~~TRINITY_DN41824_c0_g1_i1.p1  ORF type:complete len:232 (+),score=7.47 TRINITY_DN41824_c0_g1_i1:28-723(+)
MGCCLSRSAPRTSAAVAPGPEPKQLEAVTRDLPAPHPEEGDSVPVEASSPSDQSSPPGLNTTGSTIDFDSASPSAGAGLLPQSPVLFVSSSSPASARRASSTPSTRRYIQRRSLPADVADADGRRNVVLHFSKHRGSLGTAYALGDASGSGSVGLTSSPSSPGAASASRSILSSRTFGERSTVARSVSFSDGPSEQSSSFRMHRLSQDSSHDALANVVSSSDHRLLPGTSE